jgi:predicted Zn-dependent protease
LISISRFIIIFIFCIILNINSYSQKYPDPKVHALIERGITFLSSAYYDSAKAVFNRLDKQYPKLPYGSLYLAGVEIVKAFDWGVAFNESYIISKLDKAKDLADENLDRNSKDAWNNYAVALAASYEAYFDFIKESWFSVFKSGTSALKYYERCTEYDKKFYEASTAMAIFDYWKSSKTKDFSWLPFVEDNSDEAIRTLERNRKYFSYNEFLTANSLAWIYIDKKEFKKALNLCDEALKKAPTNRIIKWTKARALEEIDRKKAIEVYRAILTTFPTSTNYYYFNIVTLKHKMAMNYEKLKMYKQAYSLCEEILAITNLNSNDKNRLAERLSRVKQLRDSLKKKV